MPVMHALCPMGRRMHGVAFGPGLRLGIGVGVRRVFGVGVGVRVSWGLVGVRVRVIRVRVRVIRVRVMPGLDF